MELLRRPAGRVVIFTGLVIPGYMPHGETDGPLGAVVLARALRAVGHRTSIVTEPEIVPVVRGVAEALRMEPVDVVSSSTIATAEDAEQFAREMDIGIAIEKLGENSAGVKHTVGGNAVLYGDLWCETVLAEIRRNGGYTIGIGDNGNEIGYGKIAPAIRPLVPRGEVCRCPCGAGIVATQPTDILIPCAVSNYGGYGITAALACLNEQPGLCVTADEVDAMLHRALELGCVNGGLEESGFVGDDGVPLEAACAYATLMGTLVAQYFVRVEDHH